MAFPRFVNWKYMWIDSKPARCFPGLKTPFFPFLAR